jgi:hypothetical protein
MNIAGHLIRTLPLLQTELTPMGWTIDFYLSSTRNTEGAKRFLGKPLKSIKSWVHLQTLNTDKAPAYGAAIAQNHSGVSIHENGLRYSQGI